MGSGCVDSCFHDLGTIWVWVVKSLKFRMMSCVISCHVVNRIKFSFQTSKSIFLVAATPGNVCQFIYTSYGDPLIPLTKSVEATGCFALWLWLSWEKSRKHIFCKGEHIIFIIYNLLCILCGRQHNNFHINEPILLHEHIFITPYLLYFSIQIDHHQTVFMIYRSLLNWVLIWIRISNCIDVNSVDKFCRVTKFML
jgi:hypothetical protein